MNAASRSADQGVRRWWLTVGLSGIIVGLIPVVWVAASGGDHNRTGPMPGPTSSPFAAPTTTAPTTPVSRTSSPAPPRVGTPSIEVNPESGRPGTTLTVRGSGFRAGKQYVVALVDPGAPDDSIARTRNVEGAEDGRFRVQFTMPMFCEGVPLPVLVFDALSDGADTVADGQVFVTDSAMGAC
jgi:hypothetical protein